MNEFEEVMIYQIKFANGDCVIATVDTWVEDKDIVVKYALQMVDFPSIEERDKTFIFRPWMDYQEELNRPVFVNPFQIVSYFEPSRQMKVGYINATKEILAMYEEMNGIVDDEPSKEPAPLPNKGSKVVSLFGSHMDSSD